MKLSELLKKSRSYRRYHGNFKIDYNILKELVDLTRFSPSASNMQPLKFILSNEEEKNKLIFENLAWAGYLNDWDGPVPGERPSAYIIILADTDINKTVKWDHSIAAQVILLGATEKELGGCIIGSINHKGLREKLSIPDRYEIMLVLALGKPGETVVIDDVGDNGDIKYWRDDREVHHVPKRSLTDLILKI